MDIGSSTGSTTCLVAGQKDGAIDYQRWWEGKCGAYFWHCRRGCWVSSAAAPGSLEVIGNWWASTWCGFEPRLVEDRSHASTANGGLMEPSKGGVQSGVGYWGHRLDPGHQGRKATHRIDSMDRCTAFCASDDLFSWSMAEMGIIMALHTQVIFWK